MNIGSLLLFFLLTGTALQGSSPERPIPLNIRGIGIGMAEEAVYEKLGRPAAPLRLDQQTGLQWTAYVVDGLRVDLYFTAGSPAVLKQIGISYDEPVLSTEFGIRPERMYFNSGFRYYTYRRLINDARGMPVLMFAIGEEQGAIMAFNFFMPDGYLPRWEAPTGAPVGAVSQEGATAPARPGPPARLTISPQCSPVWPNRLLVRHRVLNEVTGRPHR